ncbi:type ii/iv secretion system atpase tadz/cpae, associated with flp pilus assembly [hydrocarbon metagenome]|uniref:Type ii/iv secretion system atpase tadz/cpae, associated with flp pilus assembly n=1 Tax=hydrocarbon metagenome TaxID=938273 RepID=A0A0W8E7Z4_9ZZZZ
MKTIRVLLADADQENREYLLNILEGDPDIDVIGEAERAGEVMELIAESKPEILIIDVNLADRDSLEVALDIKLDYPSTQVILIAEEEDIRLLKRAMQAGVREIMLRPLDVHELLSGIKQIAESYRRTMDSRKEIAESKEKIGLSKQQQVLKASQIITVFGNKGGVGKSIIAANLAVAAATRHKNEVALVDLDLQFGDISLMMNINPRKTIAELMQESGELTADLVDEYFYERSGVKVLSAPHKPELGELVTSFGVETVLKICRQMYSYTIVDTPTFLDDTTLTALEMSDVVLLLISLDIPTIKNIKKGIDILESLKMLPRTRLILNRSSSLSVGLEPGDVEKVLGMKIAASIPSDFKITVSSVNRGTPFLNMSPKAPISRSIMELFDTIDQSK